jgi:hypothetical protein
MAATSQPHRKFKKLVERRQQNKEKDDERESDRVTKKKMKIRD